MMIRYGMPMAMDEPDHFALALIALGAAVAAYWGRMLAGLAGALVVAGLFDRPDQAIAVLLLSIWFWGVLTLTAPKPAGPGAAAGWRPHIAA